MPSSSEASSSAYAFKPGGSLKFKGGDSGSSSKKSKKKSRSSTSRSILLLGEETAARESATESPIERQKEHAQSEDDAQLDDLGDSNDRGDNSAAKVVPIYRTMTEAERKFEMTRRKRLADRVAKQAKLSHKDRVDAFNRDLESRTEHFDMKRVGGGG